MFRVAGLQVLDEPTNHLDAAARAWLGAYVGAYAGTVLVVSHDAEMLRAACNSIAEVTCHLLPFRGIACVF